MRTMRLTTASAVAALTVVALAACSSGTSEGTATPAPASAAPSAAASGEADLPGTEEMRALCAEMVADDLTVEEATALAEGSGYVARVGTVDGEPQALTMDFREDRFTFETEGGVVIACTYG